MEIKLLTEVYLRIPVKNGRKFDRVFNYCSGQRV
jgi:hypothetical protein